MIFDKLFKKKEEPVTESISPIAERPFPSELERFRMEKPMPDFSERSPLSEPERIPFGRPPAEPLPQPEPARPSSGIDKLDMILQKLETIDARLKYIEEKLR